MHKNIVIDLTLSHVVLIFRRTRVYVHIYTNVDNIIISV